MSKTLNGINTVMVDHCPVSDGSPSGSVVTDTHEGLPSRQKGPNSPAQVIKTNIRRK
jgi:hypothetical protein